MNGKAKDMEAVETTGAKGAVLLKADLIEKRSRFLNPAENRRKSSRIQKPSGL
jgi:hypothetical protein